MTQNDNQLIYQELIKYVEKLKLLMDSYKVKLNNNDKEVLAKGLYGIFEITTTMDKATKLYQKIKSDPFYHYQYCQFIKHESITLLNKIHDNDELKTMQSFAEKQWLLANLNSTEEKSSVSKKMKV